MYVCMAEKAFNIGEGGNSAQANVNSDSDIASVQSRSSRSEQAGLEVQEKYMLAAI